jgi:hypothetical protein
VFNQVRSVHGLPSSNGKSKNMVSLSHFHSDNIEELSGTILQKILQYRHIENGWRSRSPFQLNRLEYCH